MVDLPTAKKEIVRKFKPCEICSSPVRTQIERDLRKKDHILANLVTKYHKFFPGAAAIGTIRKKLKRHEKHMNWPVCKAFKPVAIPTTLFADRDELEGVKPATLESFAQRMLDIGNKSLEFLEKHPTQIDLNTVVSTQRLLIEKQKVNVAESALKLSMSKFFGGFLDKDKAVEGEVADDGVQSLPTPRVVQSSHKE